MDQSCIYLSSVRCWLYIGLTNQPWNIHIWKICKFTTSNWSYSHPIFWDIGKKCRIKYSCHHDILNMQMMWRSKVVVFPMPTYYGAKGHLIVASSCSLEHQTLGQKDARTEVYTCIPNKEIHYIPQCQLSLIGDKKLAWRQAFFIFLFCLCTYIYRYTTMRDTQIKYI